MVQTGVSRVEGDVSLNLFLTTIKLQHIYKNKRPYNLLNLKSPIIKL